MGFSKGNIARSTDAARAFVSHYGESLLAQYSSVVCGEYGWFAEAIRGRPPKSIVRNALLILYLFRDVTDFGRKVEEALGDQGQSATMPLSGRYIKPAWQRENDAQRARTRWARMRRKKAAAALLHVEARFRLLKESDREPLRVLRRRLWEGFPGVNRHLPLVEQRIEDLVETRDAFRVRLALWLCAHPECAPPGVSSFEYAQRRTGLSKRQINEELARSAEGMSS